MYAYNVLLTNTCNMYEIKILLLLYVLISKKILKSRENMLYFHNTVVTVYTYYAKLL